MPPFGTPAASPSQLPGAVLVAGTHVFIVPPDGFVPAVAFQGFQDDPSGSSILFIEIPGSYGEVAGGTTDEALASKGIEITHRTDVSIDGRPSLLLEGSQQAQGMAFGKVVLITGTEDLSAIVTGNYPLGDAALGAAIRAAILTTSFDPDRAVDVRAPLRFTITPAPPLKFAGVVVNGAVYNTSGSLPSADPDEPTMLVVPSLGEVDTSDLEALAREQLTQMHSIQSFVLERPSSVTIAGLPGIELAGTAKGTAGGAENFVYEVLLADGYEFVAMIGTCPIERRAECLAAYRQTTRTYLPKD